MCRKLCCLMNEKELCKEEDQGPCNNCSKREYRWSHTLRRV